MKRTAFKFGYLGTAFQGFQRQTGTTLQTVEGEILEMLCGIGGVAPDEPRFRSAGRTDRDVSAVANCCAFSCPLGPEDTMKMLNARIEGVFFHSFADVTESFNPRHAAYRHYRYHFPPFLRASLGSDAPHAFLDNMLRALDIFKGAHDFTGFARVEKGRNPVRRILRISGGIHESPAAGREIVYVDIIGESFLWNQVRRMVGAAASVCTGRLQKEELLNVLEANNRSAPAHHQCAAHEPSANVCPSHLHGHLLHMPPRYLALMDVHYDSIGFTVPRGSSMPSWIGKKLDSRSFEAIFLDSFV